MKGTFLDKVLGEPISQRDSVHSGRLKQSMMYLAIIWVPAMS